MRRERVLKVVLVVIGLLFLAGVYPLRPYAVAGKRIGNLLIRCSLASMSHLGFSCSSQHVIHPRIVL